MVILAGAFIANYGLWLFYLASMNLIAARAHGKLPNASMLLGLPIVAIGLLYDILVNVLIMSLVFLEPPRELLMTARLKRLANAGSGWRASLAMWVCVNLLNPFDHTGSHCD